MRHLATLSVIAWALAGCECGEARPPGLAALSDSGLELPRATRSDLPPATPALTLSIHEDRFGVDNGALIETWPRPDFERVLARRPPGDAHWPRVTATVPAPAQSGSLLVEALQRVLEGARAVERARDERSTPIAFAVRAATSVRWWRVLQGLYSGAMVGWSEPRFVLRAASGEGEVQLAMPTARIPQACTEGEQCLRRERVRAWLEKARRRLETGDSTEGEGAFHSGERGGPSEPAPLEPLTPGPPPEVDGDVHRDHLPRPLPISVELRADRSVRIAIGDRPLTPGCGSDRPAPGDALPPRGRDGALDRDAVERCLEAAHRAGSPMARPIQVMADPDLPFGDITPLLELLRTRTDELEIGVRP
jgi:hypothetical protein